MDTAVNNGSAKSINEIMLLRMYAADSNKPAKDASHLMSLC